MKNTATTIMALALTTTTAFAGGSHTHQTTAPHDHGSARDISVGPNDFHHHHTDGSRHFLVCAEAVPYNGYGIVGPLYIKKDGTFYQVTRVNGGLVHTRMNEDCEVTSRVFTSTDDDDERPTTTTTGGSDDDKEDNGGDTGGHDGGSTGEDDEGGTDDDDNGGDDTNNDPEVEEEEEPKTGCNGNGCAPDSGGGNSEGNENSDQDGD